MHPAEVEHVFSLQRRSRDQSSLFLDKSILMIVSRTRLASVRNAMVPNTPTPMIVCLRTNPYEHPLTMESDAKVANAFRRHPVRHNRVIIALIPYLRERRGTRAL